MTGRRREPPHSGNCEACQNAAMRPTSVAAAAPEVVVACAVVGSTPRVCHSSASGRGPRWQHGTLKVSAPWLLELMASARISLADVQRLKIVLFRRRFLVRSMPAVASEIVAFTRHRLSASAARQRAVHSFSIMIHSKPVKAQARQNSSRRRALRSTVDELQLRRSAPYVSCDASRYFTVLLCAVC